MVVNSASKDRYIEPILKLADKLQTVLMNVIVKYVDHEDGAQRKSESPIHSEREKQYLDLLDQYNKTEQENASLSQKLAETAAFLSDLQRDHKKLRIECEELRRAAENVEPLSARMERDTETMQEIDGLRVEIRDLKGKLRKSEKDRDEEISRWKKERSASQQSDAKAAASEIVLQQQKGKLEALAEENRVLSRNLEQIESKYLHVKDMRKSVDGLEAKIQGLMQDGFTQKERCKKAETERNKAVEDLDTAKKETEKARESEEFWKQKAADKEEEIGKLKEENTSLKTCAGAGNLLSQEQEAGYHAEITRLEKKLESTVAETEGRVKNSTFELEMRCKELCEVKRKLEADLAATQKALQEQSMELDKRADTIGTLEMEKKTLLSVEKECQWLKKDRDTVLEVSRRAQESLDELRRLRAESEKSQQERNELVGTAKELEEERDRLQGEVKKGLEAIEGLTKRASVLEERNSLLKEEITKLGEKTRNEGMALSAVLPYAKKCVGNGEEDQRRGCQTEGSHQSSLSCQEDETQGNAYTLISGG